jgi:uncharacterized membrane protein YkgB
MRPFMRQEPQSARDISVNLIGTVFATVLLLLISIVTPAAGLLSGQTLWTLVRLAWRLTPPTVWLGAVLMVATWLLILRRAWTVRT